MNLRTILAAVAPSLLVFASCAIATPALTAQTSMESEMPKVLVIEREFLKPGHTGGNHERTEKLFVQAMTAAKSSGYYFAADSMSGPSRTLFFNGYPSLAAWEKQNKADSGASLTAAIDHASLLDGEQLSNYDQGVFTLRDDMSLHTGPLTGVRYIEMSLFEVKPGHEQQMEEIEKMYHKYMQDLPNQNWATYQSMYGVTQGTIYLVLTNYKTLADADQSAKDSGAFMKAMSDADKKRFAELIADCTLSQQTNLFEINPKISYPPPSWIKEDAAFWKPKAAPAKAAGATAP